MFYVFIALSEACTQTQPAATEEVPRRKMEESEEEGSSVTRAEDNKFHVHAKPQSSKEKCCRTTCIHSFVTEKSTQSPLEHWIKHPVDLKLLRQWW